MIAIVDYGMGNLRNVHRAFDVLGFESTVTDDADIIRSADKLILPGVGAFGEAVRRIDDRKLRQPLMDHVASGKPLLGICLGMQLLFETSEESPGARGLGVLSGAVVRFNPEVKVPHIGWNDVAASSNEFLLEHIKEGECFYFVHSYYAPLSSSTIASTTYGIEFSSAVRKGNVVGVQFHPEKSQAAGLGLLKRFAEAK